MAVINGIDDRYLDEIEQYRLSTVGALPRPTRRDPSDPFYDPGRQDALDEGNNDPYGGGPTGTEQPVTAPREPAAEQPKGGVPTYNAATGKWEYKGTGYQAPTVSGAQAYGGSVTSGFTPQAGGYQQQNVSAPQAFQRGAFTIPPPPKPPAPPPPAFDFASIARNIPALSGLPVMGDPTSPEFRSMLEGFSMDAMRNSNRFTTPWLTSARSVIENDAKQTREAGRLSIAELMQERGLIGSSYEGEARLGLEDQIRADEAERQMELLEMMASVEAEDRAAAGTLGLGVGRLGLDTATAKFDSQFKVADLKQRDSIQRAEVALNAAIAGDNAAMSRVRHELDVMRAMDEATLSRSELQLQSEEINLRAHQIQQEAIQRGEAMQIDQARIAAEIAVRKDELAQRDASQNADRELSAWEIAQRDIRDAERINADVARDKADNEIDRNTLDQRNLSEEEDRRLRKWIADNEILAGLI